MTKPKDPSKIADYLKSERERSRKRYLENLEENREQCRKRKQKQRLERRDEINEYQRKYYARNSASEARKQNDRRLKRLPYRGLRKAIRDCGNGTQSLFGLAELIGERVAWSNERDGSARRIRSGRRRIHGTRDETTSEKHLRHHPNKIGRD